VRPESLALCMFSIVEAILCIITPTENDTSYTIKLVIWIQLIVISIFVVYFERRSLYALWRHIRLSPAEEASALLATSRIVSRQGFMFVMPYEKIIDCIIFNGMTYGSYCNQEEKWYITIGYSLGKPIQIRADELVGRYISNPRYYSNHCVATWVFIDGHFTDDTILIQV
jgi:hypothetical protein